MRLCSRLATVLLLAGAALPAAAAEAAGVHVNGTRLPPATLVQLERAYRTEIPTGRYWYDPASGLWGVEGGPGSGQILPSLPLGGPLRADASGGRTQVFVNGRAIHPQELAHLRQLFGEVRPGRYWLNAQGVGGLEGGPPAFDLRAAGGGGYNRDTPGGGLMSDGRCAGYLHPDGPTVMTGDC